MLSSPSPDQPQTEAERCRLQGFRSNFQQQSQEQQLLLAQQQHQQQHVPFNHPTDLCQVGIKVENGHQPIVGQQQQGFPAPEAVVKLEPGLEFFPEASQHQSMFQSQGPSTSYASSFGIPLQQQQGPASFRGSRPMSDQFIRSIATSSPDQRNAARNLGLFQQPGGGTRSQSFVFAQQQQHRSLAANRAGFGDFNMLAAQGRYTSTPSPGSDPGSFQWQQNQQNQKLISGELPQTLLNQNSFQAMPQPPTPMPSPMPNQLGGAVKKKSYPPVQTTETCRVCGEPAAKHMHYGAITW